MLVDAEGFLRGFRILSSFTVHLIELFPELTTASLYYENIVFYIRLKRFQQGASNVQFSGIQHYATRVHVTSFVYLFTKLEAGGRNRLPRTWYRRKTHRRNTGGTLI